MKEKKRWRISRQPHEEQTNIFRDADDIQLRFIDRRDSISDQQSLVTANDDFEIKKRGEL